MKMSRYGKERRKARKPKRFRRADKITGVIDPKKREEGRNNWGKSKKVKNDGN